jgi:hypothetical protein
LLNFFEVFGGAELGEEGVGGGVVGLGGGAVVAFEFQLHEAIVDFDDVWPIVQFFKAL